MKIHVRPVLFFFFFNDTATTEIYTLSLHDALPISLPRRCQIFWAAPALPLTTSPCRSEEHTSELQSQSNIVCRLLLEKKNIKKNIKYSAQCNQVILPKSSYQVLAILFCIPTAQRAS